jgi:DNA-binding transcriptional LysR family regulator
VRDRIAHGFGTIVNVSLRLLRAFVAVSNEGNVGRAASRLFVSQPSLSQDIRRLEREVGVKLFDRGPKGLTLTAPGEILLRSVESSLTIFDRGIADARDLAARGRVAVRIAYSPSLGNVFMPALLAALEREMVTLDVEEHELDTGAVGPMIIAGTYDAGFAHCPTADSSLSQAHIADEPLCAAVGRGHPLAARESISLHELSGSALLIWPRATAPDYYDAVLDICQRAQVALSDIKESRRITPRTYLLEDHRTFSLLPRSAGALPRPEVSYLQIDDTQWSIPLMYLTRADDTRPELRAVEALARSLYR